MNFFHSYGLSTGIKATYVDQNGNFSPMTFGTPDTAEQGGDNFVLYDLSLNYRLPQRHGSVSLNVDNIFDESFRFQDMDPENPSIVPERMISLRFTVSY
jgi:outer membrane receptor protein involved in Fe transport